MELDQAFEMVEVGRLSAHPENPRSGDVGLISESIRVNGFFGAIVAQRSTGRILAGNHRWKAAQAEGRDRVPVAWVDVDDEHALRILLADNRTNDVAGYDDSKLAGLLAELSETCGLEGTGYKAEDLEALLTEVQPDELDTGDHDIEASDAENAALDALPERVEAKTKKGEVVELGRHRLHCVDCLELMRSLEENSVDAIVTDPPYGIGFMGKGWDVAVPGDEFAREAFRILKPGGHLIAFAATRTVHRLTVAIEDAGLEIRDLIGWLQWQGFPKSLDIAKQGEALSKWKGWGTALKPSMEPAVLARKPVEGTVAENVLKWGTGGLNIDAARIGYGDQAWPGPNQDHSGQWDTPVSTNIYHDPEVENNIFSKHQNKLLDLSANKPDGRWPANIYHAPKPSRGEREEGCEELPRNLQRNNVTTHNGEGNYRGIDKKPLPSVGNYHPTVKPTKLMRWLLRLVTPGADAVVLEPFAGSGTTLVAAEREGFKVIAAELAPEYCDIIRARVEKAMNP